LKPKMQKDPKDKKGITDVKNISKGSDSDNIKSNAAEVKSQVSKENSKEKSSVEKEESNEAREKEKGLEKESKRLDNNVDKDGKNINKKKDEEGKGKDKVEVKKKSEKGKLKKKVIKHKDYAIARGVNLPISTKHSIAISKFIRGRNVNEAIKLLESIITKKVAVKMKKSAGHKKGIGPGKYPTKAASYIAKLLKAAMANATLSGLDESKIYISIIKANKGETRRRPGRWPWRSFKRTHLFIEVREKSKKSDKEKSNNVDKQKQEDNKIENQK